MIMNVYTKMAIENQSLTLVTNFTLVKFHYHNIVYSIIIVEYIYLIFYLNISNSLQM